MVTKEKLSAPGTTSTIFTGIAERGLQGLISTKLILCTLSKKSTITVLNPLRITQERIVSLFGIIEVNTPLIVHSAQLMLL